MYFQQFRLSESVKRATYLVTNQLTECCKKGKKSAISKIICSTGSTGNGSFMYICDVIYEAWVKLWNILQFFIGMVDINLWKGG